jgi:hypothetical protein
VEPTQTGPHPRGCDPVVLRCVVAERLSPAAEAPAAAHQVAEVPLAVVAGRAGIAPARAGRWSRAGSGTRQRFTELFLRHLAQQSALEHPGAIHIDVAAQPLATADVSVLVAASDIELLTLAGRRGHQALLRPVGVVEHIQVRDYARIRPWCRGNRILAKNALSIETVYRWRAKRPRDGCLSVLRQHVEPSRPKRRSDHRHCRARWRRRRRGFPGNRQRLGRWRVCSGGRREGDRRSDCK